MVFHVAKIGGKFYFSRIAATPEKLRMEEMNNDPGSRRKIRTEQGLVFQRLFFSGNIRCKHQLFFI